MNPFLITLLTIGIALLVTLTLGAYASWGERKLAAIFQQRKGPNRVGPFGLLQPVADVLKLLIKEDITPTNADTKMHFLAPVITLITTFMVIGVIPFAHIGAPGAAGELIAIADVNIGVLYLMAITSVGVYGITLAGWSSNNKFSLMGGLRASAQMVSYELAMGLAVVSVILVTNYRMEGEDYLRVATIVEAQRTTWNILINPLGFIIFLICAFAEAKRAPFDLIEAEQELVGGYHTEYSSMRFGMFMLVEFLEPIIGGTVISTLWLGGYLAPFEGWLYSIAEWPFWLQIIWGASWLIAKVVFCFFIFSWVRWTIPRFKYGQLMDIGWKRMLPLALINLLIVATVVAVMTLS